MCWKAAVFMSLSIPSQHKYFWVSGFKIIFSWPARKSPALPSFRVVRLHPRVRFVLFLLATPGVLFGLAVPGLPSRPFAVSGLEVPGSQSHQWSQKVLVHQDVHLLLEVRGHPEIEIKILKEVKMPTWNPINGSAPCGQKSPVTNKEYYM